MARSVAVVSKSEINLTAFLTLAFIFLEKEYGSRPSFAKHQLANRLLKMR